MPDPLPDGIPVISVELHDAGKDEDDSLAAASQKKVVNTAKYGDIPILKASDGAPVKAVPGDVEEPEVDHLVQV